MSLCLVIGKLNVLLKVTDTQADSTDDSSKQAEKPADPVVVFLFVQWSPSFV